MEVAAELREAGVTAREAEVLDALGARFTNAEIADRLFISIRTVESHVSALLRKLGEPDRRALAARARTASGPETLAFPRSLATDTGMPFVGRARELADLDRVAEVTRAAGVRRLGVVVGEAGIGKSRLAAEFAARSHAAGAVVLHGRCAQEALVPYQALAEAAQPLATSEAPVLVVPNLPEHDRGDVRYRLFEGFDRFLAASRAPIVLVLDDIHWIDPSGLQLLRHLVHHAERSPLLILATARPEATDPSHPLNVTLAAANAAGALEVITVGGLSRSEAGLLADHLGASDNDRIRRAWERTGGNPFLLNELFHDNSDQSLPATARDAIARRVAGLGPGVFDALSAAAIAGERFQVDLVAAALGSDASHHRDTIDRAFRAGLVTEDSEGAGTYRFAHAIVREALAAITSPGQRTRLHLAFAQALESLGPASAPDVARHRHAALPSGDPALARRAAIAAFDRASDGVAYELAAAYASMALDAIETGGGTDVDRADALVRRGEAHLRAGQLHEAIDDSRAALRIAAREHAPALRARAALAWADAAPVWGREPGLRGAIDAMLRDGVDDIAIRARLKAKLAQLLYYEADRTRQESLAREAIEDARASGQEATLSAVLSATHASISEPAALDRRLAVARESATVAASAQQPYLEIEAVGWLAVDLLEAGDVPAANHEFARHRGLADHLGQRLPLRDAELWSAMRATLEGRFDDAATHIERARDFGEAAGDPAASTIYWVQRYWLSLEQQDPTAIDDLVDPCERITRDNPDVPAWRAALALLHARRNDHDRAAAAYEMLAKDDFSSIPADAVWLNAMTYLAEACAILGDRSRAQLLFDLIEPYADRIALIDRALACKGSVHRFLGLLAATKGDRIHAEQHLNLAAVKHHELGAVALVRRTAGDLRSVRVAPPR